VLSRSGIGYDLRDVILLRMPDRPGELGKVARKLARAMVNVDSIYMLSKDEGMTELIVTVDNPKKAGDVLR